MVTLRSFKVPSWQILYKNTYGLGSTNGAQKSDIPKSPQNRLATWETWNPGGWEVDTKYGKTYSTMIIN